MKTRGGKASTFMGRLPVGTLRGRRARIARCAEALASEMRQLYQGDWTVRIDHRSRFILILQRLEEPPQR